MIERFILTTEIAEKMKRSLQGDDDYFKDAIKERVCQLWEFTPGTFVITRLELNNDKTRTLVVCCFQGKNICLFTEKMIEFCISTRIEFMRFHTRIKQLGRIAERKYLFYKIAETPKESVYLLRV